MPMGVNGLDQEDLEKLFYHKFQCNELQCVIFFVSSFPIRVMTMQSRRKILRKVCYLLERSTTTYSYASMKRGKKLKSLDSISKHGESSFDPRSDSNVLQAQSQVQSSILVLMSVRQRFPSIQKQRRMKSQKIKPVTRRQLMKKCINPKLRKERRKGCIGPGMRVRVQDRVARPPNQLSSSKEICQRFRGGSKGQRSLSFDWRICIFDGLITGNKRDYIALFWVPTYIGICAVW